MDYDPNRAPDPEAWLALDEHERIELIQAWHDASNDPLPDAGDWYLHSTLQAVVETQLATNEPAIVRPTLERLMNDGLDRHDALHVIASQVAELMFEAMHNDQDNANLNDDYIRALSTLSAEDARLDEAFEDEWTLAEEPNHHDRHFSAEQQHRLSALMEANSEQMLGFPETAGFLFAMVCCPEPVKPSQWLEVILGEFEFADQSQAEVVFGDLMALNNWIVELLEQGRSPLPPGCEPASDPDDNFDQDLAFNRWVRGFGMGHGWAEEIWAERAPDDVGSGMSLMCLTCFSSRQTAENYHREIFDSEVSLQQMITAAHQMIPHAFQDYFNAGRKLRENWIEQSRTPVRSTKIGRNEPCPCGSGKKYKKCCGQPGGPTSSSIH